MTRLVLGLGLTAVGALAFAEGWAAAAYTALAMGLVLLVVGTWRWLERDLGRRVRWSDEHRARVLLWAGRPAPPPAPGPQPSVPPAPAEEASEVPPLALTDRK